MKYATCMQIKNATLNISVKSGVFKAPPLGLEPRTL